MNDQKHKLILDSFVKLAARFDLIDKKNLDSTIDETVGDYIVNTIQQLYEDYESHKVWMDDEFASDFDLDNFVEIIDAYLAGFRDLDPTAILNWLITLKKEIDVCKSSTIEPVSEPVLADKSPIQVAEKVKVDKFDLIFNIWI